MEKKEDKTSKKSCFIVFEIHTCVYASKATSTFFFSHGRQRNVCCVKWTPLYLYLYNNVKKEDN